jgi:hypothetical protein
MPGANDRVFQSGVASAALFILLPNGDDCCVEEVFIITIHLIVGSGFVSMWRKIDFSGEEIANDVKA